MGLLELNLGGGHEVRHAGGLVSFRTRKALGMLAYLCLEPGMHSREELAALLWPESEPDAARANLRTTLMYLRKPLKHEDDKSTMEPHLRVERQSIGFNFDADYRLDLDRWRALAKAPSGAEVAEFLASGAGTLMAGFSLSNAGPFEDWLRDQRAQWRSDLVRRLDRISEYLLEQKLDSEAERAARRWIDLDPFDEKAHRRLMRIQVGAGDRAGALRTFDALRERLQEEMGIEPMPDTQALAERIRQERTGTPSVSPQPPSGEQGPLAQLPFVGRENPHSRLVRTFHAARQRGPQVAIIEGEAGIGKTRLAREFLQWTRSKSATVLTGGGRETGAAAAYQPIVEAFRPRLSVLVDEQEGLGDVWLKELARIFPEILEARPELGVSGGDPARAMRLYESLAQASAFLSRDRPLILFIDDLQWVDPTTLDLLSYLARRSVEETQPLLILGCVRKEDLSLLGNERQTPAWLRSLDREIPVERVILRQLTEEQTRALLRRLLASAEDLNPAEDELIDWLYRESHGHPFFLAETLKAILDKGLLVESDRGPGETRIELSAELRQGDVTRRLDSEGLLPHGVKEIVRDRIAGLPQEAMDLLASGAILGQEFRFDHARKISGYGEGDGLRALDLIQSRGLWIADEAEELAYSFSHDKVRDVVYTEAGSERRRLYHRRALDLLSDSQASDAELARHAEKAGLFQRAFELRLQAGRSAMSIPAVQAARSQFELARRVLVEQPGVKENLEPDQLKAVFHELGRALELMNQWDQARDVYSEYLEWARGEKNAEWEALALIRLAGVGLLSASGLERSEQLLTDAVHVAQDADLVRAEAEAHARLSHKHFITAERTQAIAEAQRAVELAEQLKNQELLARSLNALSYAVGLEWPSKEAGAIAARAGDLYVAVGDRPMEIDCAVRLGSIRQFGGHVQDALQIFEQAADTSREIDNEWGRINALNHAVSAYIDIGELGQALSTAQKSVELARRHPGVPLVVNCLNAQGFALRVLGRYKEALESHQEALQAAEERTPEQFATGIACQLCADHLALGDWAAAEDLLARSRESTTYSWIYRTEVEPYLVHLLLKVGEAEAAEMITARLSESAEGNPRLNVPLRRCEARLSLAASRPEAAAEALERGVDEAVEMNLVWPRIVLMLEWAPALRLAGDEHAAEQCESEAHELLETAAASLPAGPERETFKSGAMGLSSQLLEHLVAERQS